MLGHSRRSRSLVATVVPRPRPRPRGMPTVHSADCPCCRPTPGPAEQADDDLSGAEIACWCVAGILVGPAAAALLDWLVGGPGALVMFGAG